MSTYIGTVVSTLQWVMQQQLFKVMLNNPVWILVTSNVDRWKHNELKESNLFNDPGSLNISFTL